jgi:hypothetical protein
MVGIRPRVAEVGSDGAGEMSLASAVGLGRIERPANAGLS